MHRLAQHQSLGVARYACVLLLHHTAHILRECISYLLFDALVRRARRILSFGPIYDRTDRGYRDLINDDIEKVIFLDFDGVVNDEGEEYKAGTIVDEAAIKRLKEIVDATGADIVLTSSRRSFYADYVEKGYEIYSEASQHMDIFERLLEKYDLYIEDITSDLSTGPDARPLEIRTWLRLRSEVRSFVILDDDSFWNWMYLTPHFVRTITVMDPDNENEFKRIKSIKRGLTDQHVKEAIRILNMYDDLER